MEYWADLFDYSPSWEETCLHGCSSSFLSSKQQQQQVFDYAMENNKLGWTNEENKLFEDGLAEIEADSPAFFENVASRIPWKSIQDIQNHYHALIHDLNMIETGRFPLPEYDEEMMILDDHQTNNRDDDEIEIIEAEGSSPSSNHHEAAAAAAKTRNGGQQRRRGVPWTQQEHQLFLMGLKKYGKGDWRSISRYYVITKTPTQVASHAQKYFRRQNSCSTPLDRRRPSIHDITTLTSNSMININEPAAAFISSSSSSSCHDLIINRPTQLHNQNFNPPPPMSSHHDNPIFNHMSTNYTYSTAGSNYLLPSLPNKQYWG